MAFYILEPEAPGDIGWETTGDLVARPPKIDHLEFEFIVWPKDCLIETTCIYLARGDLVQSLVSLGVKGASFASVDISTAGIFDDMYGDAVLPRFWWMKIDGRCGVDDFGMSQNHRLVVSERVFSLLRLLGINHCEWLNYPKSDP